MPVLLTRHENVTLNCTLKMFNDTDGESTEKVSSNINWWEFVAPILAVFVLLLIIGVPVLLVMIRNYHNRQQIKNILQVSPTKNCSVLIHVLYHKFL